MKISCKIEASDYVRAQYVHLRPRPLFKYLGIILILLFVGVGLTPFFITESTEKPLSPYIIWGVLIYLALSYGVWLPYRSRKVYKQQKSLQEPYEIEISEEAFVSSNLRGTAKIQWSEFHKYKVGKDVILLYQSDLLFHMFQKRWFSKDQYKEFLAILEATLGKPKT